MAINLQQFADESERIKRSYITKTASADYVAGTNYGFNIVARLSSNMTNCAEIPKQIDLNKEMQALLDDPKKYLADHAGTLKWIGKAAMIGLVAGALVGLVRKLSALPPGDATNGEKLQSLIIETVVGAAVGAVGTVVLTFITAAVNLVLSKCAYAIVQGIASGVFAEVTEGMISEFCQGVAGAIVGIVLDVVWEIYRNGWRGWKRFLTVLGDSIVWNGVLAGTAAVLAPLLPCVGTVAITLAVSLALAHVRTRCMSSDNTLLGYLWERTWSVFFPKRVNQNKEHPEWCLCPVTATVMINPVYVRGYVCERSEAERRIRTSGKDFGNSLASEKDIIPMPELKGLINRYIRETASN